MPLEVGGVVFDFARAYVVGVLNVTPDSFSDGGRYDELAAALERGREMAEQGADIIDVGGESTRPGAEVVDAHHEIDRVVPILEGLRDLGVPLSIDTTKAAVAEAASAAGASIVNDISGGLFDGAMIETVARLELAFVLGHVRGDSIAAVHGSEAALATVAQIEAELAARLALLPEHTRRRTIVDPGLGFGKPGALNLALTRNSGALATALQCPVMIGPSRKRYLGALTGREVGDRDDATIGAALAAVACGAHFVRVHAVERVRPALTVFEASMAQEAR